MAAVDSPDGATSLERSDETPSLTQAPLTSEVPQSPPGVTVSQEEEEVRSLREALRSSEDQVQLIHSEYRSICREKDDTIRSLKAALEQTGEHQRGEVHQNYIINLIIIMWDSVQPCGAFSNLDKQRKSNTCV